MSEDRRVVVIGSGPAGAMAARELVSRGIAVTMLDSGIDIQSGALVRLGGRNVFRVRPALRPEAGHEISGDPKTHHFAQHALGGLSNNWTGAVPRYAPQDFTDGERLHERYRWPVSYADLVPFYEEAERLLKITGSGRDVPLLQAGIAAYRHDLPDDWQAVQQLTKRYGQGFTTMPIADGAPNMIARRSTAFNSYAAIVRPMRRAKNFELKIGMHALRLQWSGAMRKVEGVTCFNRRTKETEFVAANAVVVACGALASAKLLHNSDCSDFPEGLGNSHGLLGRFLHDHPREWWMLTMDRPRTLLAPPAYLTRLPHEVSTPLLSTSWTLGTVGTFDTIRSRFGMKSSCVGVQVFGTMVPTENSYVKPSATLKDEFGLPNLNIRVQFSAEEVANVVRARQHLLNILEEAGSRSTIGEVVPTLHPGTSVHYGGTVRMHANPNYGVLDAWNRVHDAHNVVVCDSACFTTGSEKNPTLTIMALAARAAARLAGDLKHSY
jgi:choline dehydrogenase-like flavoprotein